MDIQTAALADLGRFIAGRTGDAHAARIALSTAPQLRYDVYVCDLARDSGRRAAFTDDELRALVARIADADKRRAALREL